MTENPVAVAPYGLDDNLTMVARPGLRQANAGTNRNGTSPAGTVAAPQIGTIVRP